MHVNNQTTTITYPEDLVYPVRGIASEEAQINVWLNDVFYVDFTVPSTRLKINE